MVSRDGAHTATTVDGRGPGTPVLVVAKVRSILDAFTTDRPQLTIGEIRQQTGLPTTTCQRLVQNMCTAGFLARDGERYRIGIGMLQWMSIALDAVDVVSLSTPVLRNLRDRTGETACLFVRDNLSRVVVALAGSRQGTVRRLHVGEILPLHAGSAGKVFLAYDDEVLNRVLAEPLESYTSSTIVDPSVLRQEVHATRAQGYAVSLNEGYQSASSLSAPVFDHYGHVEAAVCLAGPSERLNEKTIPQRIDVIVTAADELTQHIGGRTPREETFRGNR